TSACEPIISGKNELLTWYHMLRNENGQTAVYLCVRSRGRGCLQRLPDDQWKCVNSGLGLAVQRASRVRINVRNLIIEKLRFVFSVLPDRREMTLIVVEAALSLVLHVVSSTEDVVESNVGATNEEIFANVAIL